MATSRSNFQHMPSQCSDTRPNGMAKRYVYLVDVLPQKNELKTVLCSWSLVLLISDVPLWLNCELFFHVQIDVDFWDTAGQERFNKIHPSYYHDAHCCLLVFDITRKITYKNLEKWLEVCSIWTHEPVLASKPRSLLACEKRRLDTIFAVVGGGRPSSSFTVPCLLWSGAIEGRRLYFSIIMVLLYATPLSHFSDVLALFCTTFGSCRLIYSKYLCVVPPLSRVYGHACWATT